MSSRREGSASKARPRPLTRPENAALYQGLLDGDKQAQQKIVEGNMALVTFRVQKFLNQMPHLAYLRDDINSAGILGLTTAVKSMAKKRRVDPAKVTGYLSNAIQRSISNYVDSETTIVVPDRTDRHARSQGKKIEKPKTVAESESRESESACDPVATLELMEEVEACCQGEIDVQIVRRAAMGYTDKEIGEVLGLTFQSISRHRADIYDRFLERTGMKRR